MNISIDYRIRIPCGRLLESVYRALEPELVNLPSECNGGLSVDGEHLVLRFNCQSISKILALNNSFIGVLLMLLELVGDNCYERETAPTRDSTTSDTIPDS